MTREIHLKTNLSYPSYNNVKSVAFAGVFTDSSYNSYGCKLMYSQTPPSQRRRSL